MRHYDVVIVGSGFGGSVTALRLVEKGYKVAVIEAGRRFADDEFSKSTWDLRRFLWAPQLGFFGIQRIHLLRDVLILAGAGVGGGSLNYANTLYKPPSPFFNDLQWADITDWDDELSPFYDQARRMLGVVTNPHITPADKVIQSVAADMGVADTWVPTPVGVFFDEPGVTVPDPYFGGKGPARTGCTECGQCMTGCRVGAKNTLVKNYLGLAEAAGVEVIPMTTVKSVTDRPGGKGGFVVDTVRTGPLPLGRQQFSADKVVLAAGTYGTQTLLHRLKDRGKLPRLSDQLGVLTRTNSESLLGASSYKFDGNPEHDYSRGVAITSSFYPEPNTHIEPTRYGPGSNAMSLLQTLLTDAGTRRERFGQLIDHLREHPGDIGMLLKLPKWGQRTIIMLVMQSLDNSLTTFTKKTWFGTRRLTSRQGHGAPNPTSIPVGAAATRLAADKVDGIAGGTWGEVFNIPLTAHFLGGAAIGADASKGVIDAYHRAFGHPDLYVVDGAAVSANLGVNPSLTIAAQAERAASLWPNKGEADLRPEPGTPYRRIAPIAPNDPVVPADAPGALRLPLFPIKRQVAG